MYKRYGVILVKSISAKKYKIRTKESIPKVLKVLLLCLSIAESRFAGASFGSFY